VRKTRPIQPGRPGTPTDRRRWIKSVIRNGALGTIAVVAGHLAVRRVKSGCSQRLPECESCRLLSGCRLPTAISAREAQTGEEHSL